MDYTTLANVKAALGADTTAADTLLSTYVTRASRMIDRYMTGAPDSDDYLMAETVTDEQIYGRAGGGKIITAPRKPLISSVSAAAWRLKPSDAWTAINAGDALADNGRVELWTTAADLKPGLRVFVKLTYVGGLAASVSALPADVVEQATATAIRLYREAMNGLTDVIGVSEMGVLMYAKAWPVRVREALQPYVRTQPWSGAS